MYSQIQVLNKFKTGREKNLQSFFGTNLIKNIKICDIYRFNRYINTNNYLVASELLSNPISQEVLPQKNVEEALKKYGKFSWVLEIGFLPGVTDNLGSTAAEIICEKFHLNQNDFKIKSSQLFLVLTSSKTLLNDISEEYSNSLINSVVLKSFKEFIKGGNNALEQINNVVENKYITKSINLNLSELNLKKIGINSYFEYVAGSDTFNFCKPDARHLTNVVEIMNGDIKKSIMIGDSEVDGKSAENASMTFILLEDGYTDVKVSEIKCTGDL